MLNVSWYIDASTGFPQKAGRGLVATARVTELHDIAVPFVGQLEDAVELRASAIWHSVSRWSWNQKR
jgi:hypothetical protein